MIDHQAISQKARGFFEDLWRNGDYWDFQGSDYEHMRCQHLLRMLDGNHYHSLLEIGCGAGVLTRMLAPFADQILALDISQTAIERAQSTAIGPAAIDFRVANIMDDSSSIKGPWDLIVFSDTLYYLGWLYPFFDVAWLAVRLFEATKPGGHLLLANSMAEGEDWLLRPWLTRTYRDLFVNVGYAIAREEVFNGVKKGMDFAVLMTLFVKNGEASLASNVP
jgi:predicted TPR repeat methyltransferase